MGHHSPALGREGLGSTGTRTGFAPLAAAGPITLASLAALAARAKGRLAPRAPRTRVAARPVPATAPTGTSLAAGPWASAGTAPAGCVFAAYRAAVLIVTHVMPNLERSCRPCRRRIAFGGRSSMLGIGRHALVPFRPCLYHRIVVMKTRNPPEPAMNDAWNRRRSGASPS